MGCFVDLYCSLGLGCHLMQVFLPFMILMILLLLLLFYLVGMSYQLVNGVLNSHATVIFGFNT